MYMLSQNGCCDCDEGFTGTRKIPRLKSLDCAVDHAQAKHRNVGLRITKVPDAQIDKVCTKIITRVLITESFIKIIVVHAIYFIF